MQLRPLPRSPLFCDNERHRSKQGRWRYFSNLYLCGRCCHPRRGAWAFPCHVLFALPGHFRPPEIKVFGQARSATTHRETRRTPRYIPSFHRLLPQFCCIQSRAIRARGPRFRNIALFHLSRGCRKSHTVSNLPRYILVSSGCCNRANRSSYHCRRTRQWLRTQNQKEGCHNILSTGPAG
jgi:hypothetical protein